MLHKQWQIVETCAYPTMYNVHKPTGVCATHGTMLKNHLIFIALIFLLNHNSNATNQIVSNFARNYNTVCVYVRTQLCTIVCIKRKGKQKGEDNDDENLAKNEIKSIVEWTRIHQLFVPFSFSLSLRPNFSLYTCVLVCVCVDKRHKSNEHLCDAMLFCVCACACVTYVWNRQINIISCYSLRHYTQTVCTDTSTQAHTEKVLVLSARAMEKKQNKSLIAFTKYTYAHTFKQKCQSF